MKINWIEINLPWQKHFFNVDLAYPILEREKERFGKTVKQAKPSEDVFNRRRNLIDELEIKVNSSDLSEIKVNQLEDSLWEELKSKPDYLAVEEWKLFRDKVDEWYELQPEVKEYHKKFTELQEKENKKSFCGQRLNNPGTLIELENGSVYLIGSINCLGGVCDDCHDVSGDDIVKRYAVLFTLEELKLHPDQ